MSKSKGLVPHETIERRIVALRGHRVMLDFDLAEIYGVTTSALNQAVSRNMRRFPEDFMIQLNEAEWASLRSQIVTLKTGRGQHRKYTPYAFTEQGVAMLSSVLRSDRAITANIQIMRAFVKMREVMISHKDLARKLGDMENKYDHNFKIVFDALRQLIESPQPKKKHIGYIHHDDGDGPTGRRR